MYLDSVEVSRRDEKVNRELCLPMAAACAGLHVGAVCGQGGMLGERKSLKTLQKQTLQSSMAYSDALTMKLLEIQPTWLLLNVTGLAMLTVCPSHSPPPNPNTVHHVQIQFSAYCSIVTPAFLIQNTLYVNEGFTPYPLCLSIKRI